MLRVPSEFKRWDPAVLVSDGSGPVGPYSASPGSWDHAMPFLQMKAIDLAMRHYFGRDDWLAERRQARQEVVG